MKKLHILLSTAVLLLVSCKEEVEKPKVIYDAAIRKKRFQNRFYTLLSDSHSNGTDYLFIRWVI
jgi:hypothetical protein